MSFRKPNNVFATILSDVTVATSALPAVGTVVTDNNTPAGAVVMVDAGMRRTTLATLATGDAYKIVQGKGADQPMMKSPTIIKGSETISIQKHLPRLQQITVIGYNGTTGTLPNDNSTSYYVKIRKNDNDAANRSQPFSLFGQYKTDATATVEEVAFGLAENLVANFRLEPANKYLSVEVLSDGTIAVVSDGAQDQDAAVVNGSTEITLYDTGTTTAGATAGILAAIPPGSFVNIAGATYEVKSLNANVVTLTTPYVGASGTITGGTTLATQFGEVTTITVTGLRLTGVLADFDVNAFRDYYSNRFTASFSDASTLITSVQGARNGSGVWQQVAMDEYMSYGYEGQNEMISVPPKLRDQVVKVPGLGGETALTSKYSTINIKWTEGISTLVTSHGAEGNVIMHLNLEDSGGSGILDTGTANTGETLADALGLTPADLDE